MPPNWTKYFDTEGRHYYYNKETGKTQWNNPNNSDQFASANKYLKQQGGGVSPGLSKVSPIGNPFKVMETVQEVIKEKYTNLKVKREKRTDRI